MPYGMANGLSDFVGGFTKESDQIRNENYQREQDDSAREKAALEHLANADDPQVRTAAVTALLTPKKGQSGLAKWFGEQRKSPVFDQIHQLINGDAASGQPGVQPFMTVQEREAARTAGGLQGRLRGANAGYQEVTGQDLPAEDMRRGALGALGAPPPRPLASGQPGMITYTDEYGNEKTVQGTYDKVSQGYYGPDSEYLSNVTKFTPSAAAHATNPTAGGMTTDHIPDHNSPTGYSKVHTDAYGTEIGRTTGTPPPPGPPSQIFPSPTGGFTGVDPRKFTTTSIPAPAGAAGKPEDPTANFNAVKQMADEVYKRAAASVPNLGGLGRDQNEMNTALNREAQVSGYPSWADLQKALKDAQGRVGTSVPPPPSGIPDQPLAPTATPAPKGAAGAKGRTAPRPGAPPKKGAAATPAPGTPGQIDVNAVLAELNKLKDF